MNSILVLVKLKENVDYDKYTDRMFFRVLDCYDYKLVDIFTDAFNRRLYYYFTGPNKITDYMYYEIYNKLRELIPKYAYIKKVEPKKTHIE